MPKLTLMTAQELVELKVGGLGSCIESLGMQWLHLPIKDGQAPDRRFEFLWPMANCILLNELNAGNGIFIHCKGGLGRAGTVVSLLLIESGVSFGDAIARVRAERSGAIETHEQEAWLQRVADTHAFG